MKLFNKTPILCKNTHPRKQGTICIALSTASNYLQVAQLASWVSSHSLRTKVEIKRCATTEYSKKLQMNTFLMLRLLSMHSRILVLFQTAKAWLGHIITELRISFLRWWKRPFHAYASHPGTDQSKTNVVGGRCHQPKKSPSLIFLMPENLVINFRWPNVSIH